jgi:hypothetical protein
MVEGIIVLPQLPTTIAGLEGMGKEGGYIYGGGHGEPLINTKCKWIGLQQQRGSNAMQRKKEMHHREPENTKRNKDRLNQYWGDENPPNGSQWLTMSHGLSEVRTF